MTYWTFLGAIAVGLGFGNLYWIVGKRGHIVNYISFGFCVALGIATMVLGGKG